LEGEEVAMSELGKTLVAFGVVMVIVGVILLVAGGFSGKASWIGRLPGDIYVQRGNWSFYFPLATCLLVSVILTLLFAFFGRR
jgi:Protein of unknown function (DUF2905)